MQKPRAYSYIRFSRPEQMRGDSYRRQLDRAEKWAKENGFQIDEVLQDLGVSARHGKNRTVGALSRFYKAIEEGRVPVGSVLIVESLDRLSRQEVIDVLPDFLRVIRAGVEVVTLEDGQRYAQARLRSDWSPLVISLAVMARAHSESSMKEQRQLGVWEKKRAAARERGVVATGALPAWLKVEGQGDARRIVLDEDRAPIVVKIFEATIAGHGRRRIVADLNARKVETFGTGKRKATEWLESYVMKILRNRAAIGEYQPRASRPGKPSYAVGEPIKGYYPAVVDEGTFLKAQRALQARRGRAGGRPSPGLPNLFQGLVHCSECGSRMEALNKGEKGGRWFRCGKAARGGACGNRRTWPFAMVEDLIASKFVKKIAEGEIGPNGKSARDALEEAELKLAEMERERQRKFAEFMASSGGPETQELMLTSQRLAKESTELKAKVTALQAEVAEAPPAPAARGDELEELRRAIAHPDVQVREAARMRLSQAIRTSVTKITFGRHSVSIVVPADRRLHGHGLPISVEVFRDKWEKDFVDDLVAFEEEQDEELRSKAPPRFGWTPRRRVD